MSAEYHAWYDMMQRCYNPARKNYHNYGGRGIKVCEKWHTFTNFVQSMGRRPPGYSLERENNDGDYSPQNCRWATASDQALNRRNSLKYTLKGCVRLPDDLKNGS